MKKKKLTSRFEIKRRQEKERVQKIQAASNKSKSLRKYSKVSTKQQEEKSQGAKQRHEETDREVQSRTMIG